MKKNLKKAFYLLILGVMFYAPNAMAAVTCQMDSENLKIITGDRTVLIDPQIPHTVALVYTILKIAIPVLLVILGMIDLLKGVTAQKEDEIKKGQQTFIKRLIAAVIVFFVFTIVQIVVSFAAGSDSSNIMDCAKCFINGSCGQG